MDHAPDLVAVIEGWFKAAVEGDVSWRDAHVSRDPSLRIIGTDPEEFLTGTTAYEFLRNEAENVGGRATVEIQSVEAFSHGDVGWGVALPRITLMNGDVVTPRWSAVFRREDGEWRMVQLHASVAIGNEEAFGDTFVPA